MAGDLWVERQSDVWVGDFWLITLDEDPRTLTHPRLALARRVEPKGTGRPGYDPTDLLKLYLYGYLNRVRSSRRLGETRSISWIPFHLFEADELSQQS
jgi:hypothetical protein